MTTETIRKDIVILEQLGVARKQFGGATLAVGHPGRRLSAATTAPGRRKAAIAARALELVEEGASVFIDGGSTTQSIGEVLSRRSDLTIFTNSVPLLAPLTRSESEVFVVGGRLHAPGMSSVGRWAVDAMRSTSIDIAFLGTDGVRGAPGPTSASYEESAFKAAVIAASTRTVVLAESTKFAHTGLFAVRPWAEIDALVTDPELGTTDREALEGVVDVLFSESEDSVPTQ